jgi:hypothetical protein
MVRKKLAQYTSTQKNKMSRQFCKMLKTIKPLLTEKYGDQKAIEFQQQAMLDFEQRIIPAIPYIGGQANPYTIYLEETGMALALYHTVLGWGGNLEEAGELIYKGMTLVVSTFPKPLLHLYGRWSNSKIHFPRMRKDALNSLKREYPGDWVYEFVEGNNQDFDYGVDMHECGILNFLAKQNASELAPYLCAVDYITYYALGVELKRDETLVVGCQRCNFRIKVPGKPLTPSWPPNIPEENK